MVAMERKVMMRVSCIKAEEEVAVQKQDAET
jgi:hypothetical protein